MATGLKNTALKPLHGSIVELKTYALKIYIVVSLFSTFPYSVSTLGEFFDHGTSSIIKSYKTQADNIGLLVFYEN
jgi:hypothetical protein